MERPIPSIPDNASCNPDCGECFRRLVQYANLYTPEEIAQLSVCYENRVMRVAGWKTTSSANPVSVPKTRRSI